MPNLHEVARPGLMLSQTWPSSRETSGDTLRALEYAVAKQFFHSFQTVEVPFSTERKAISRLLDDGDYHYDYCVARVLNENGLNLSDLDATTRRRSYQKVIECLQDAREAGADSITVIAGPRPESSEDRSLALQMLTDSLAQIAIEASKHPAVDVVIEPLDVEAHKRRSLGYTPEAVEICRRLQEQDLTVCLLLDTAHMILNNEDPAQTLSSAKDVTAAFHYCNCVTDKEHSLYGDRHMRFGSPGVVGIEEIAQIMGSQLSMGFFDQRARPPVLCEVLRQEGEESEDVMEYCMLVIQRSWETFQASQEED